MNVKSSVAPILNRLNEVYTMAFSCLRHHFRLQFVEKKGGLMIYPDFIKKGDTIGICAPSAAAGYHDDLPSYINALDSLQAHGFKIKETAHVRCCDVRGGSAEERGKEFSSLFCDATVKAVLAAAGGDFNFEILPFVDWETIRTHPKWTMGASDPTCLLYTMTTCCDIATFYGYNAKSYDEMNPYKEVNLMMLKGASVTQQSSPVHAPKQPWMEGYSGIDVPTVYQSSQEKLHLKGRCIGGCIDVLKDMIGTTYENTAGFIDRYSNDGILWYFDVFSLSAEALYRTLLQMKYAGWFRHCKGVLIGRILFQSSDTGMTYRQAVDLAFAPLSIPWVMEMDIGHTVPAWTMINGAIADVSIDHGEGSISFECI